MPSGEPFEVPAFAGMTSNAAPLDFRIIERPGEIEEDFEKGPTGACIPIDALAGVLIDLNLR